MKYLTRAILTVMLYTACTLLDFILRTHSNIAVPNAAVGQLENSDAAYMKFALMNRFVGTGWPAALTMLVGFYFIWRAPMKSWHPKAPGAFITLVTACVTVFACSPAHAYYDKTDRAEWVNIEANQSAFLIPALGANKTSQKQFGSVDYLTENKVAAKRVQIPHVIAANTALMNDYYVPGATLYIVDRSPYTREWVDATDRGTSSKKEGMRFESADSIDITTGVSISASVTEADAATFFYYFGAGAVAPTQDPAAVFTSVKYGRSLAEVMDTNVRARVHSLMALEFAKRKFMVAIGDKAAIMALVEKTVQDEFAKKGITISFVGFAEGLTFDTKIQAALNDSVIASIQYGVKDALLAVIEINRKNAEIDVIKAQAATMQKWNGQINFPFFMPDSIAQAITGWLKK